MRNIFAKPRPNTTLTKQNITINQIEGIIFKRQKQAVAIPQQKDLHQDGREKRITNIYTQFNIQLSFFHDYRDFRSQLIFNFMNSQKVMFKCFTNEEYFNTVNYQFKEHVERNERPLMAFKLNFEEPQYSQGFDGIKEYLEQFKFVEEDSSCLNETAEIKQISQTYIQDILTQLDLIFLSFPLAIELNYKAKQDTDVLRRDILINYNLNFIPKILRIFVQNFSKLYKNKKQYLESPDNFVKLINQYTSIIGNKDFHGGNVPDYLDLQLYSAIQTKYQSKSFRKYLEDQSDKEFYNWFIRMQQKCLYKEGKYEF